MAALRGRDGDDISVRACARGEERRGKVHMRTWDCITFRDDIFYLIKK